MKDKRINRISSEVKKAVSEILTNEIKDPRVSNFLSVTDVKVSKDLAFADIYISILGGEQEKQETMQALEHSKGFVRSSIGKAVNLRLTPEPRFHLDESIEQGIRMNQLIKETIRRDKERMQDE